MFDSSGIIVHYPTMNKIKETVCKRRNNTQHYKTTTRFLITYYAKKYQAIITRRGTWTKPNTNTQGKHFVSKDGNDVFVYWDLDATPNQNGNATNGNSEG